MNNFSEADEETALMKARPNPFLYAIEGTRAPIVIAAVAGLVVFLMHPKMTLHLGLTFGLAVYLKALVVGYFLSILYVSFIGSRTSFAIKKNRVVLYRRSIFSHTVERLSIPISAIRRVETRRYNETYGSVYLKYNNESSAASETVSRPPSPLTEFGKRSRRSSSTNSQLLNSCERIDRKSFWMWVSLPISTPRLSGFWGFKEFRRFADLIIELKALT